MALCGSSVVRWTDPLILRVGAALCCKAETLPALPPRPQDQRVFSWASRRGRLWQGRRTVQPLGQVREFRATVTHRTRWGGGRYLPADAISVK